MGFLNDIIKFVSKLFSGEGILKRVTPKVQDTISDTFYRKMVKTGKSRENIRKIFSLTFEQSYQPTREDELVEEWELMGYGLQTEYGYTREEHLMMGTDWNFIYPNIKVGAE